MTEKNITFATCKIITIAYNHSEMNTVLLKIKENLGTQAEIAATFGVKQPAVCQWFANNKLPLNRALKASEITGLPIDFVIKINTSNC